MAIYGVFEGGRLMGYEVIKIRLRNAKKIAESMEKRMGKKYEGELLNFDSVESYPKDDDFGYYGWFYMPEEKDRAIEKYCELLGNSEGLTPATLKVAEQQLKEFEKQSDEDFIARAEIDRKLRML